MTNSIQELQEMILNTDTKLSSILQHALVVASKHDKDSVPWIKKEINGYESAEDCPKHRNILGVPKAKSRHSGHWISYVHKDSEFQNFLSKMPVINSSSEIENWFGGNPKSLSFPYPETLQKRLSNISDKAYTRFALEVQPYSVTALLNGTRSELLNWVISLDENSSDTTLSKIIFPQELISRLPKDLKILANDFNFNFSHNRTYTCMLILRRMLPLSIVRRFQEDGNEKTIKKDGEYLNTSDLLAKTDPLIGNKLSTSLRSRKMLLDSSQHLYGFHPATYDVERAADALRLFLGEFFPDKNNNKNQ